MKKMIPTLVLLFLSVVLAVGCSKSNDRKDNNTGKIQEVDPTPEIPAECYSGVEPNGIAGRWHLSKEADEIKSLMTFDFTQSTLRLSNTCTFSNGRHLTAEVRTDIEWGQGRLQLFNSDQDTQRINEAGFDADCSVSVQAAVTKYSFAGQCLILGEADNYVVLQPGN